ncbi:MAG: hemin uptake protein HemP [Rhizobiaceae bacterium]|jgi:hemin uptake protein HemP|nr:MAG: hemin uptake protein HemP [Rhizobiaceae bacterium]
MQRSTQVEVIRRPLGRVVAVQRAAAPLSPSPARTILSEQLFRGTHEIGIEHHGALYRLKITRQGKLILNK